MKNLNPIRRFAGLYLFGLLCISNASARVQHLSMPTAALTDSNRVIVCTPIDFNPQKAGGYPFIIMLHGWSGDETQWEQDANLQYQSNRYGLLLILPDGGYDGWWLDASHQTGRDYATYLHEELPPWIETHFNGSSNSAHHGILGLSMGGFGTLLQVLHFPDDYAAAASLSGVMDITRHSQSWGIATALGPLDGNLKNWQANNPLTLASNPAPANSPAILLICGRDDITFAENQDMVRQLQVSGYPATLQEEAGAHTHIFWKTHVGEAVAFLASHLH